MASFHDVRLLENIEQGAHGGPSYSTSVVQTTSGYEQRTANWSAPLHKWNVASGLRSEDEYAGLLAFFHARMGQLYGFRFKDWADFQAVNQPIVQDPVNPASWYLAVAYTSGGVSLIRRISRPVLGTVVLAAPTGGGAVPSFNAATRLCSGPGTWTGEFDVPVRFQADQFNLTLSQIDIGNAELNVIEIRE